MARGEIECPSRSEKDIRHIVTVEILDETGPASGARICLLAMIREVKGLSKPKLRRLNGLRAHVTEENGEGRHEC
jgi:hypothetical protein